MIRLLTFLFFLASLHAERGIVVACSDKYVDFLVPSLAYLRWEIGCKLPIEVWYAGDELSSQNKERLIAFGGIAFKDIVDVMGPPAKSYWGYHIKPLIVLATHFDEVLLMDADIYFYQDPERLFDNPHYIETGAFFFRDQPYWQLPSVPNAYHGGSIEYYRGRKAFFLSLIDKPSRYMPHDWRHYWEGEEPTFARPYSSEHQESGCVAFDKRRHSKGLEEIVKLNLNRAVTYKHMLGDKETYWIGLEMAKEPYYVNPSHPYLLRGKKKHIIKNHKVNLVHLVDDHIFFQQKQPIPIGLDPYFIGEFSREPTESEREKLHMAYFYKEMFTSRRKLDDKHPFPIK